MYKYYDAENFNGVQVVRTFEIREITTVEMPILSNSRQIKLIKRKRKIVSNIVAITSNLLSILSARRTNPQRVRELQLTRIEDVL